MNGYFEWFDRDLRRENTACEKWDARAQEFGRPDVTPLWVADMDFLSPAEVTAAIMARAAHGVYGYRHEMPDEKQTVVDWVKRRHGLSVQPEDVLNSPGVVNSIVFALKALLPTGSRVAIQPPVYGPFYAMIERAGMELYLNPLKPTEKGYEMDLENLEQGLKQGVKALLLSNPHNPVGRVFTSAELRAVSELLGRYGARLISDEIHGDIIMPGHKHVPCLSVDEKAVMLISATKTFNLAGLKHSSIIVKEPSIRRAIVAEMEKHAVAAPNLFGIVAQKAAYQLGEPWLEGLLDYLRGTALAAGEFFKKELPDFPISDLQGTYLQWADFRALSMKNEDLVRFFADKAGVGLTGGGFFGPEGDGFLRINLASRRDIVIDALTRMKEAMKSL